MSENLQNRKENNYFCSEHGNKCKSCKNSFLSFVIALLYWLTFVYNVHCFVFYSCIYLRKSCRIYRVFLFQSMALYRGVFRILIRVLSVNRIFPLRVLTAGAISLFFQYYGCYSTRSTRAKYATAFGFIDIIKRRSKENLQKLILSEPHL